MSTTALITGASSGIGRELAKLFAEAGNHLVLVARSEDKLNALANEIKTATGNDAKVMVADLAAIDAGEQLYAQLQNEGIEIDYLVNNAGFGELGKFANITLDRQLNMVRLNVVTLMHLTRLLTPKMIACRSGGVLNVGSTAAFQPGPNMAVYYATKAFVLSFSEALHEELLGSGVHVSCLCPGPTKTGFGDDSGMNANDFFQTNAMDVRVVAQAGYQGLLSNRAITIPGWKNKLTAFATRIAPRFVVRKIVKRLQSVGE